MCRFVGFDNLSLSLSLEYTHVEASFPAETDKPTLVRETDTSLRRFGLLWAVVPVLRVVDIPALVQSPQHVLSGVRTLRQASIDNSLRARLGATVHEVEHLLHRLTQLGARGGQDLAHRGVRVTR